MWNVWETVSSIVGFGGGNLKGRDHMEKLSVEGRII
jgi:hypothetical protein